MLAQPNRKENQRGGESPDAEIQVPHARLNAQRRKWFHASRLAPRRSTRSEATKQSRRPPRVKSGLLRGARHRDFASRARLLAMTATYGLIEKFSGGPA